jgi:outer membrane protein OmpA-like peptidoglycan-associated protein
LVIRLRALEFPVNQSVLRGSNFPLLAKVAKVIEGFESPTVVVEGHTDSDGGKVLNQRLSTERAKAVEAYLVSSEAIDPGGISAVGYGFDRPLASNKTAKGKAQNRRVDIIISPQMLAE